MDIYEFFKRDRYAAMAGVELLEAREGYARAAMPVTPKHLNAGRTVQGGAIFTLADLAFAAAVNAYGTMAVSLQTSIWYHKAISAGTLFAEAKEIKTGRTTATFDVTVTDGDGELIATFVATAFRKDVRLPFAAQ
jgi:acyl-CoA thioesterase